MLNAYLLCCRRHVGVSLKFPLLGFFRRLDSAHIHFARLVKAVVRLTLLILCLFQLLLLAVFPTPSHATDLNAHRFFHMGDGKIHIQSAHNGREADVNIWNPDGSTNEDALKAIDEVFGLLAEEKDEHISLRLICMLDYFSDITAPGKTILLESGYRSPSYNDQLRKAGGNAARTSTHIDGMAADFYFDGVDGKQLWELIRREDCSGVGHYGGRSVHLDAGRPRFWEAATSKVGTGESDFNRRIYSSTEYDRYKPGETLRLSLSSVSDFGFGIKKEIGIVNELTPDRTVAVSQLHSENECLLIKERKASRFIYAELPRDLAPGRYRIRIEFCEIPFPQMSRDTITNMMEILGR